MLNGLAGTRLTYSWYLHLGSTAVAELSYPCNMLRGVWCCSSDVTDLCGASLHRSSGFVVWPILPCHVIFPLQGKRESEAVREYAAGLAHSQWRVFVHERINRPDAPELLTIYRL